jgi:hypothetical protein
MYQELNAKYSSIASIPERRQVFVDDILGFYNSNNRANLRFQGVCIYSQTDTSPGCAIGRCLSPEVAKELDNNSDPEIDDTAISSFFNAGQGNKFPVWMTEMGVTFLSACQTLHDKSYHWNEAGPTQDAKEFVEKMIKPLIAR